MRCCKGAICYTALQNTFSFVMSELAARPVYPKLGRGGNVNSLTFIRRMNTACVPPQFIVALVGRLVFFRRAPCSQGGSASEQSSQ
jgi:hypothetical protein